MTTDTRSETCEFCWRPSHVGGHNEGCPIKIGTKVAREEWERGYQHGFHWDLDDYGAIQPYQYGFYSKTYLLGYRAGEAEIEELVDQARERNYGYDGA